MIDLDLHQYKEYLTISTSDGKHYVWDPIRKKKLIVQPEELVRQLLIMYLVHHKGYPISRIQVERSLKVLGMQRRFDIIVYDHNVMPYLLVECKSHREKITQKALDQVGRYNISITAPYLLITNGVQSYAYAIDPYQKTVGSIEEVPSYPKVI